MTRLPSGQRYFDDSDGRRVLFPSFDESRRRIVIYCRVSSPGRRDDLALQVAAMEQFCLGRGEVAPLAVAYRDRLDLLAAVDTFSCRLYGLCRYVNTVKDELAGGGR